MIKKYYKKIDKEKILSTNKNAPNKFDNFCDTIINIDWAKIYYNRMSYINWAISKFKNCKYLEIGCANNICFRSIPLIDKIGVDPNNGGNIKDTSDNFFKNNKKNFDIIFIDGLHIYEQCRKDVINALKVLNRDGFIFIHDMTPRSWVEENVPRLQEIWSGNVWKVGLELAKTKGINFFIINADHGIGVIKKNENDVVYHDDYENIKKLKFKDFLKLNEQIKYVEAEEAFKLI
tara:strand:- start:719 stop:1417 length:699 start_codon:yes stop_codon:yes gene_type:complete